MKKAEFLSACKEALGDDDSFSTELWSTYYKLEKVQKKSLERHIYEFLESNKEDDKRGKFFILAQKISLLG